MQSDAVFRAPSLQEGWVGCLHVGTLAVEQLQELQGCPWIPSSETLAWSCSQMGKGSTDGWMDGCGSLHSMPAF